MELMTDRSQLDHSLKSMVEAGTATSVLTVRAAKLKLEPPTLRMMNVVLMEPGKQLAPPKRRTRKAKRTTVPIQIGTILKYFSNLPNHKECGASPDEEGGNLDRQRKRKCGLVEATEQCMMTTKSMKFDDETLTLGTSTNSRTKCPLLLGDDSGTGREPDDRLGMGAIGLDLMEQRENDGGMATPDWTNRRGNSE